MFGLELGQERTSAVSLAQITSEQCIDEPGLAVESVAFCQLDTLMNGRMVGNALQPEDLVEAQAQDVLNDRELSTNGGYVACSVPGLPADQPIERRLPPHHAIDEFLAKAPVCR